MSLGRLPALQQITFRVLDRRALRNASANASGGGFSIVYRTILLNIVATFLRSIATVVELFGVVVVSNLVAMKYLSLYTIECLMSPVRLP